MGRLDTNRFSREQHALLLVSIWGEQLPDHQPCNIYKGHNSSTLDQMGGKGGGRLFENFKIILITNASKEWPESSWESTNGAENPQNFSFLVALP